MAIRTTFICDGCGTEVSSIPDTWYNISVAFDTTKSRHKLLACSFSCAAKVITTDGIINSPANISPLFELIMTTQGNAYVSHPIPKTYHANSKYMWTQEQDDILRNSKATKDAYNELRSKFPDRDWVYSSVRSRQRTVQGVRYKSVKD